MHSRGFAAMHSQWYRRNDESKVNRERGSFIQAIASMVTIGFDLSVRLGG